MSREISNVAGAEAFSVVEGNMCGAVMRGAVALPRSKTPSRTKGLRRNLGDLLSPAAAKVPGRTGKLEECSRSGRQEESDGSILPRKRPNKVAISTGGGCGGKGPGWEEWSMLKHAPDTAPDSACHRRHRPADRN